MGSEFNPAQSINYNGVMRYWAKDGDLLSYTASADALELYITTSQMVVLHYQKLNLLLVMVSINQLMKLKMHS